MFSLVLVVIVIESDNLYTAVSTSQANDSVTKRKILSAGRIVFTGIERR